MSCSFAAALALLAVVGMTAAVKANPTDEAAKAEPNEMIVTDEDREFWSFRPLKHVVPPLVQNEQWVRTPIDRFILAKLEAAGLEPTGAASKRKLIRRASFDLIGLPPRPEQVDAFGSNPSADAYEQLIDRLLADPHYGERWGRHWLDVARFAESHGYETDDDRRNAYRYRDAVIEALNVDMPFDQFAQWQLAGDEYKPDNRTAMALTGFLAAGPSLYFERNDRARYEKLDDIISTVGSAFLGLTVGCARCHDHKYDPIPTRDYYELLTAFNSGREGDYYLVAPHERKLLARELDLLGKRAEQAKKKLERFLEPRKIPLVAVKIDALDLPETDKQLLEAPRDEKNARQTELFGKYAKQIEVSDEDAAKFLTDRQKQVHEQLKQQWESLKGAQPPYAPPKGYWFTENGREAAPSYLLARGNWRLKQEQVQLGFLKVLMPANDISKLWIIQPPNDAATPYLRRSMSRWLTDVERGAGRLVARVIVNRLWYHHFSKGIVATPGNFGSQGDSPSHPELLEWLATTLIENGWRLKPLHKLIMTSAVYMQDTTLAAEMARIDPDNRLWWRRRPSRVEAEIVRDTLLAVSGCLNGEMCGPSVRPWIHPDAIATGSTKKWPTDVKDGPSTWRRSIYIFTKRSVLTPMLESFDLPDATASCTARNVTTTAPAALFLLNNPFTRDQAQHFAKRVTNDAGADPRDQVLRVYQIALSRPPRNVEWKLGAEYLTAQAQSYTDSVSAGPGRADSDDEHRHAALVDFCHAIMGLNEFIYID